LRPSLSVLLPVRNCQATLADLLRQLLELVPELTDRFELVVIDDGSVDATIEVADEFAAYYPQVRAIRHARPAGQIAAVRTGLTHSSGQIVLVREADCQSPLDEIPKLWQAVLAAQHTSCPDEPSAAVGRTPQLVAHGGFRIFTRGIVDRPHPAASPPHVAEPTRPATCHRPKTPNYLDRWHKLTDGR